jgi:propionyl-CoA synthetase
MENEFGVKPGEVFWAASDVGWVVGHSYIVYAPLLHGCTTILFEGKPVGTPDAGTFWRVISEHGVVALFTAPTAFRAIKQGGPGGRVRPPNYDLSKFRTLFLAGERADPHDQMGRNSSACRSSTIGGRPRPARRSASNPVGWACCR